MLKDIIKYYVNKKSFVTKNKYLYTKIKITEEELARTNNYKKLKFHGTNPDFTKIQEDPRELIAFLTFAIFFTNSYEKQLQRSNSFNKLNTLRKELYF